MENPVHMTRQTALEDLFLKGFLSVKLAVSVMSFIDTVKNIKKRNNKMTIL
jgi:hypothetical protein